MTNTCINGMSATTGMSNNLHGMQMCIYFNKGLSILLKQVNQRTCNDITSVQ
jgi:hypothetical protein